VLRDPPSGFAGVGSRNKDGGMFETTILWVEKPNGSCNSRNSGMRDGAIWAVDNWRMSSPSAWWHSSLHVFYRVWFSNVVVWVVASFIL
jgi:hypothetical protein